MDPIIICDTNCRIVENRPYLTDKYVYLLLGAIFKYFSFILNYDRIFKLTPKFSKVGGVN